MNPTQLCILVALALAAAPTAPGAQGQEPAQPGFDHSHAAWTAVLQRHVRGDRFDYKALSEERGRFDAYLLALAAVTREEFQAWTREQQYAFWIDAYNAFTVQLVLQHYPVESIKDVGGTLQSPWKIEFVPLGQLFPAGPQKMLSLDDIEQKVLRPKFKDARVHAAVNCASIGCPPLRAEAFVADRLDAQLDEQARAWLADGARNQIDSAKSVLRLSKIFDWYAEDFVRDAQSVQAWVARYAPAKDAVWLATAKKVGIEYLDYSWKLNDIERPKQ